AVGYAAHGLFTDVLGRFIATPLPPPSLRPALSGFIIGLVTLLGFALPPLLALKNVPAFRVLRRELGLPMRGVSAYLLGIWLLSGLMIWQAGDFMLGIYIVAGTLATLALLALVAWLLVRGLALLRTRVGVAWRFGLANIARRPASSVTQILAFGAGIMGLLLLTLVRGDLLASWQESLPGDAPNRFIINIQAGQLPALRDFFVQQAMPAPEFYPMVRGRLVSINDKPVSPADYKDERAAHLAEREFNLSWMERLPADNRIIAGEWWQGDVSANLLSVEEGIATTLGVKLGDTLSYNVAGETFTAQVTSLRKVDWDSFHVNFFVIATPHALKDYPASYITSFYLPEPGQALLGALVKSFPNLTVIDVAAIMTQVRAIIERVTLAVEYVFGFTLLAGFVVLYAALQATRDERLQDTALLRTLGARRRQLVAGLAAEFLLLGALAGLMAAFAASVLAYVLAERVLHLPYGFNVWIWLTGLAGGGAGVALAGVLGMLPATRHPPIATLRAA
ncbi:MAG: ABC transporter permease, partial [Gammaproteobacteria bacterium]|nr:ABC transporter permease [Gammaproteobacteria bacterium]